MGPRRMVHMDCAWERMDCAWTHRMTCTCALMTSVSDTVKPSKTLESSMNFFHPQSCSFLQNRCRVSAERFRNVDQHWHGFLGIFWGVPEYLDFLGSLLTTAMVNCAKWLHPVRTSV